jgi:hypothetical protein
VAFTVEDFHDLIELLAQHPEWRAELRRYVLSDDLLALPDLVRQLIEAQTRAEARLDRLESAVQALIEAQTRAEARLDRLESAVQALVEAQTRAESRLERVENRLERVENRLERLDDRVGKLDGKMLEIDYARKGPSYFSPIARRLRVVEPGPLADLLDDAVDAGQLTEEERRAILLADVVLTGRMRSGGQDVYLAVEVSVGIGIHDVERAAVRAAYLEKLGRPVLPVVAGERINDEAAAIAQARGVWYVEGGHVTAPQGS